MTLVTRASGMFIETVPLETATGALAEFYHQQLSAWGFLPNFVQAFSTRPEVAQAWTSLNKTVRDGMDRRRLEIATIGAARQLNIRSTNHRACCHASRNTRPARIAVGCRR